MGTRDGVTQPGRLGPVQNRRASNRGGRETARRQAIVNGRTGPALRVEFRRK